jgi:hypothetical protein
MAAIQGRASGIVAATSTSCSMHATCDQSFPDPAKRLALVLMAAAGRLHLLRVR